MNPTERILENDTKNLKVSDQKIRLEIQLKDIAQEIRKWLWKIWKSLLYWRYIVKSIAIKIPRFLYSYNMIWLKKKKKLKKR